MHDMTVDPVSHIASTPGDVRTSENGTPSKKLGGYDFYRSIGSPKYVVAPMVDQSELAWRMLSRSPLPPNMAGPSTVIPARGSGSEAGPSRPYVRHPGGAHLVYTPMIHAKVFATARQDTRGADGQFNLTEGEEGSADAIAGIEGGDRPLFVQFCANDPEMLLAAARKVEKHCDAVDINFGCPQGIAKRGHYGSFLQDEWDLIYKLINILHVNLSIPVTAKFRIHPDVERTIAYAKMMESAGAQILTVHGRTREQKGQMTGLADWEIIKLVKQAVKVPVFANGNILYSEDVERCTEITGVDGVMSAEGNLSNPALFLPADHPHAYPPATLLAHRYLDIVASLKTPTAGSAIKAHLFRLLKPILDAEPDETLRIKVANCFHAGPGEEGIKSFREVVREVERSVQPEMDAAGPSWRASPVDPATGYRKLPVWVAQPYLRAVPVSAEYGEETAVNGNGVGPDAAVPGSPSMKAVGGAQSGPCQTESCGSIAAIRCPHNLCLLHCRVHGAISASADAASTVSFEEAVLQAKRGDLVGKGCEAHEEKYRAKMDRENEKKRLRAEGKRKRKEKKQGEARGRRQADEQEDDGSVDEDEALRELGAKRANLDIAA